MTNEAFGYISNGNAAINDGTLQFIESYFSDIKLVYTSDEYCFETDYWYKATAVRTTPMIPPPAAARRTSRPRAATRVRPSA